MNKLNHRNPFRSLAGTDIRAKDAIGNRRIARLGRTVVIALTAAAVTVGLQASAGINGPTLQPYSVNSTVAGMPPTAQTLWAVVASTGSTTRAFPRATTTSWRIANGTYEVDFYENVDTCSYQVTLGNGGAGTPPTGYASVAARASNPKGVFVQTFNFNGVLTNAPFHLAVHC